MLRIHKALRHEWQRIQFCPPLWAICLNPLFVVRRGLYRNIRVEANVPHRRVLDFGAGSSPYRHLFQCHEYVTVDIADSGHPTEAKVADVFYDGRSLPFASEYFDCVFSSEVLEHVFNIDDLLDEVNRVLCPGGTMLLTIPFVWNEHEVPFDFARYTTFAIHYLLQKHGFVVRRSVKSTGYWSTIAQMVVVYFLNRRLMLRFKPMKLFAAPFLFAPILLAGMMLELLLPNDQSFYHNNIVVAVKPQSPRS